MKGDCFLRNLLYKMRTIKCSNGCCKLAYTEKLIEEPEEFINDNKPCSKTGVYLLDLNTGKILLSQSYNDYWGIPKGTKDTTTSSYEKSATRELNEETGIEIDSSKFSRKTVIRINDCDHVIYYVNVRGQLTTRNPDYNNNESTGVGWIKPQCVDKTNIRINRITRLLIKRYSKN